MKEYHVLNLGAGVQSTMLYLLATQKHPAIIEYMPKIDVAIFADTGEEPRAVYRHLEWLKSLNGPEILVRSTGSRLGDDLKNGTVGRTGRTGRRFATIPAFTANGGMSKRQCTMEYKVAVIERAIRREIVGLKPRQRFPKNDVHVHQYMGLSYDEAQRVLRVNKRFYEIPWATPHFPLFETNTDRGGAINWLASRCPHQCPRSACVFCPYHDQSEWNLVRSVEADWKRACEIDDGLRSDLYVCSRERRELAYVHRSCVPLRDADLTIPDAPAEFSFVRECEGMCGV